MLIIVYFSYRQTIEAYPDGGGSYTVARENLGAERGSARRGRTAADYMLTAAVGISAGVGALVSAAPSLLPHTARMCSDPRRVTIVNLRGVREAGAVFMIPTYLFVGTLGCAIVLGTVRVAGGGHPVPLSPLPSRPATATVSPGCCQSLRERLHRPDRRRSRQERRKGVPRTRGGKRQAHAHRHHLDSGYVAGGIA